MKRDVVLKAEGHLAPRAIAGRLIGYLGDVDGYLIMIENGSIFKSQHVYFFDLVSPLLPYDVKAVPAKFNTNLPIDALFGLDHEMDLLLHHWKKDMFVGGKPGKKGKNSSRMGHPPLQTNLNVPLLSVADSLSAAANLPVEDDVLLEQLPRVVEESEQMLPVQAVPIPASEEASVVHQPDPVDVDGQDLVGDEVLLEQLQNVVENVDQMLSVPAEPLPASV